MTMASSSSSFSDSKDVKPVVVRVKRKASQELLDALWLEISERPLKRPFLDLGNLSITEFSSGKELKAKRIFVRHVETVSSSDATKDILQSFRPIAGNVKEFRMKLEERRHIFKQENKQDQLRSTARQMHGDLVKSARFKQIWKSRKRDKEMVPADSLNEFYHLYDVVRVDAEEERPKKLQEDAHLEENAILCNYLPLIREFLPAAAAEIEADLLSYSSEQGTKTGPLPGICMYLPLGHAGNYLKGQFRCMACSTCHPGLKLWSIVFTGKSAGNCFFGCSTHKKRCKDGLKDDERGQPGTDGYVYDLYAVGDDLNTSIGVDTTMYPLVQVDDEDEYYDGPVQSEFESDDSNAEDNPLNDYPDEQSSEDEEAKSRSSYDQSDDEGYVYEEEIIDGEDEDGWRWQHR